MQDKTRYTIFIRPVQGGTPLVYHVDEYVIVEGGFLEFTDNKSKKRKRFHSSNCEININKGDVI